MAKKNSGELEPGKYKAVSQKAPISDNYKQEDYRDDPETGDRMSKQYVIEKITELKKQANQLKEIESVTSGYTRINKGDGKSLGEKQAENTKQMAKFQKIYSTYKK